VSRRFLKEKRFSKAQRKLPSPKYESPMYTSHPDPPSVLTSCWGPPLPAAIFGLSHSRYFYPSRDRQPCPPQGHSQLLCPDSHPGPIKARYDGLASWRGRPRRPLCCISPAHKQEQPHTTGTRKKPCLCLVLGSCTCAELLQQRGREGLKKASRPERDSKFPRS
jgi:hypothetical protein